MQQEWTIQNRGHQCSATGKPFAEDEYFYALLFDDTTGYRREDLCEEAYKARPADAVQPFSFWRTKYTPPPPAAPETLGKQTAEDLLRSYMAESTPMHASARYLLAVMLERKRILKEVQVKRADDGSRIRVYERAGTGEVFVIPDPELKLEELEQVQNELAGLLAPGAPRAAAPSAPSEPTPAASSESTLAAPSEPAPEGAGESKPDVPAE